MAGELGFQKVLLIGHGGKLIKLAAGIMNTHSSMADGRMEIIAAWAGACGVGETTVRQVLESITVEQALESFGTGRYSQTGNGKNYESD